ncbi:Ankyrin-3 [Colletotrichum orbiculare MAFF 240422]|uniref:Ankyrin-3 n=1 Tax=Colletotrichum orbiculare (strain 104-T / ATCC 96160 / CBS 514.97 / LARS 414 / MAFF 240422) TaxID=1213857 RepID=N4VQT8_COLOR|nr:Ankyrin-3 [Colletotrichum orbiculare MAFF 240422]
MSSTTSDDDAVPIGRDDVSNYNPNHILPESPETIQGIRAWLGPTAYADKGSEHSKHLASLAEGTGDWVTGSNAYTHWLEDEDQGLLWIKGVPGAGKSVLAAKITRDLSVQNPGTPVLYFFFRQIIDANHETVALLKDWLDQILEYSPPLQKRLKNYVTSGRPIASVSVPDLWKDLRAAVTGLHGKVFCVADALDEMDAGHDAFLQALSQLSSWKPGKVKVLITSRSVPAVEIPLRLSKGLHIRLQHDLVDDDISRYVRARLQTSDMTPEDQRVIREAIPGRANGLFLYAKLAMDSFLEAGARVDEVLELLPSDMNAMYAELLGEHSRRTGIQDNVQLLILQWATHATRPLRLLEMAEAIRVVSHELAGTDLRTAKDLIRTACGPLLELLPDETLSVVHHSLTEYLKGETRTLNGDEQFILLPGPTHTKLGLACLRYLQSGCLSALELPSITAHTRRRFPRSRLDKLESAFTSHNDTQRTNMQTNLAYPFFAYAASNWHVHLARSMKTGTSESEIKGVLDAFFHNDGLGARWLDHYWDEMRKQDGHQGVTPLHVAARYGFSGWAHHMIASKGMDINVVDAEGKTPLFWAAEYGVDDVVRVLVAAGASVDQDETVNGYKPLHKAAQNNHPGVVTALLEAGASPTTEKTRETYGVRGNGLTTIGETPLMYACHDGHLEAVEAFIPFLHREDPDVIHRALVWAAEKGRSRIVDRLLREPNVDINRMVRKGTPLFHASRTGNMETVTLLLRHGADPSIICEPNDEFSTFDNLGSDYRSNFDEAEPKEGENSRRGSTALWMVCRSPCYRWNHLEASPSELREALELFVANGADVHQRTWKGSTLLHAAYNCPVRVRLLLDHGVDANIAQHDGNTPLHFVPGAQSIAQLVEHGKADVNRVSSSSGMTPLLCAVEGRASEPVLELLEYDPAHTVTDRYGNGVLHLAARCFGFETSLMDALLRVGADPNLENKAGQTPLEVVTGSNEHVKEATKSLIGAGADVNARDKNGASLLFRRIGAGAGGGDDPHEDVKLLLSMGARPDVRDLDGRTLLHEAVRCYDDSRFDFLVGLGLDLHAKDHHGNGLLHEFARHSLNKSHVPDRPLTVWRRLFALGLDADQANRRGRIPLHNMCCQVRIGTRPPSHGTSTILIVAHTKDVNRGDRDGITPLHLAVTTSEYHTKLLLDAGADPRIATKDGLTPLHLAVRSRKSNIVGLLLDHLHQAGAADSDNLPRGAWLVGNQSKAIEGVNAKDSQRHTPLHLAIESGRPEVVSLLLRAGASVKVHSLRHSCERFEREQDLWTREAVRDPENGDAGGLTNGDVTRAFTGPSTHQGPDSLHPWTDTARLEEIVEMLLDRGADLSEGEFWEEHAADDPGMSTTTLGCRDYTLKCLTEARRRRGLNGPETVQRSRETLDEHSLAYRRDAAVEALRQFGGITKGESNRRLFVSRLRRREFELVEELFHLGVDFIASHGWSGLSNLDLLVQNGYTALVERIGRLEAERQHVKGTWHAAGDETRPGFGRNTTWNHDDDDITQENHAVRVPLLIRAVSQELPVFDTVRVLVEQLGVDVNELQYTRQHLLQGGSGAWATGAALHVVARGDWWWQVAQALPYLISRGASLEVRNGSGQTPLHAALASEGFYRLDVVRLLVRSGADVKAADGSGKTCLGYAGSDVDSVRLLIGHGAEVRADAVFSAIDRFQPDVLEALLSAGTSPNLRYRKGTTDPYSLYRGSPVYRWKRDGVRHWEWYPLYHAATKLSFYRRRMPSGNRDKCQPKEKWSLGLEVVGVLLAHGADPYATYDRCLDKECAAHDEEGDDLDFQAGEKLHHEKLTVLHELLLDGHVVHPILALPNLDVERRDAKGRTLLLAACGSHRGPDIPYTLLPAETLEESSSKDPSLLRYLICRGADAEARDAKGRNALHYIFAHQPMRNNLHPSVQDSILYMAKHHPSLINQRDSKGKTPFLLALDHPVHRKNANVANVLLAAGADPLAADKSGVTALHLVARKLWIKSLQPLFEELLRRGCDVNARDVQGEPPLFKYYRGFRGVRDMSLSMRRPVVADQRGAVAAFEAAGADFTARNENGQGLLHIAAAGHYVRFKRLLQRGLDPMMEDDGGKTPLDVAAACDNAGVLRLFEAGGDGGDDLGRSGDDLDSA